MAEADSSSQKLIAGFVIAAVGVAVILWFWSINSESGSDAGRPRQ